MSPQDDKASRGVSSTVKLSVSKTELGGSNPSAPARILSGAGIQGWNKEAGKKEVGKREVTMATMTEQNALVTTVKSWPERIKSFYNDVRTEMRKVTAPTFKEVQATTTVVIVTVFIFALYFAIIDFVIQHGVTALFDYFRVR
jgi:preprotein translocase subunit SecE